MCDLDLAYLAGVIDSDGYVTAAASTYKGRQSFGLSVGIAGTSREPHDLAASLFGGTVRRYVHRGTRSHYRDMYQWQRYGRSARPVVEAILPYLRIKKARALVALDLQDAVDEARLHLASEDPYPWFGPGYTPERELAALAGEVRAHNLRGRTHDEFPASTP